MELRLWLKANNLSVREFAEGIRVRRTMVYRYFDGVIPRCAVMRRITSLTKGEVTVTDFYNTWLAGQPALDQLQATVATRPAIVSRAGKPKRAIIIRATPPDAPAATGVVVLPVAEPMSVKLATVALTPPATSGASPAPQAPAPRLSLSHPAFAPPLATPDPDPRHGIATETAA